MSKALAGEICPHPPIWLMRQAGRYLPEYRALRATTGSFLDLCLNPAKAAEITLQPIHRFNFDAAIVFSDILMVPYAFGQALSFVEGEGPRLDPVDAESIARLDIDPVRQRLSPVFETITRVRDDLAADKALIGFCGAPWTVATYMIAGRGTPDQKPARLMATRTPALLQTLMDRIVDASVISLLGQIEAGANVVQIFDSWAGILNDEDFDRWSIAPTKTIIDRVRSAAPAVPIIGFPKGAGLRLERYAAATGVNAIGIDWTVPVDFARDRLQPVATIQGNLDPLVLVTGGIALDDAVDRIVSTLRDGPFIFNLGHGIVPETPIAHVEQLVARVRGN
ncbi:MAG: uroporphyrinogen decarboxylase [Hyphomicrobiales bacterium]|nr:uroporphyrinogen decarboxylase [Hyphomicrobiales bacterium]